MRTINYFLWISLAIFSTIIVQAQETSSSKIRVGHFASDTGPVDVYVDGELLLDDFVFPDLTDWLEITNSPIEITITPPDGTLDEALIPPVNLSVDPGEWYTISAIGEFNRDTLQIHMFKEDFSPIDVGETRITVFNTIPDPTKPLDFFLNDTLLIGGLGYPGSQGDNDGADTRDVVAQSYDLRLTESNNADVEIFTSRSTVLGRNRHYIIIGIGLVNKSGVFATTNIDEFQEQTTTITNEDIDLGEGNTRLRVAHLAPDAEPLDLYINGTPTELLDLSYITLSDWISIEANIYEIALAPAGTSIEDALIGPFNAALIGNEWNTLAIVGFQENNSLIARIVGEDYTPIPRGESRLTFFNAIPDALPIDIVINDQVFAGSLEFPGQAPTASDGAYSVTVAARPIDIEITDAGNLSKSYIELFDTQLTAGNHYFIAAVNRVASVDYYLQVVTQEAVVQSIE